VPSGQVRITVHVSGGFGDEVAADGSGAGGHWEVLHSPGACAPCVGNNDPHLVPFPGCNGNIAAKDPDDAKALAIGNLCRCKRVWVEDH
jgi:hypothetical protein